MAIIGTITKQPRESLVVDISYATFLGNRSADSITPTVEVPAGMTNITTMVSGDVVQVVVSGGSAGSVYRWCVLSDVVIGGLTNRLEDEFHVVIQEVSADTTLLADVAASGAGTAAPILAKRAGDARDCVIDFGPVLRRHELLTVATDVVAGSGLQAGIASVIQSQYVQLPISGGSVPPGSPHQDYDLKVIAETNRGSVQGNVTVRVFP